jgi:hypothetical protein
MLEKSRWVKIEAGERRSPLSFNGTVKIEEI